MNEAKLNELLIQLQTLNGYVAADEEHYFDKKMNFEQDEKDEVIKGRVAVDKAIRLTYELLANKPVVQLTVCGGLVESTMATTPMEVIIVDHDLSDQPMSWHTGVDYVTPEVVKCSSNLAVKFINNGIEFNGCDVVAVNPDANLQFSGYIEKNTQGYHLKLNGMYVDHKTFEPSSMVDTDELTVVVLDMDENAFELPLWCITEFQ